MTTIERVMAMVAGVATAGMSAIRLAGAEGIRRDSFVVKQSPDI